MTRLAERLETQKAAQSVARPQADVLSLLQDKKLEAQIARALPRTIGADRFMRTVLTTVRIQPRLLECTRDSFLGALMLAAQLGLEPGPLGLMWFVPFRNTQRKVVEVVPIIGYRGFLELARRSGTVQSIKARTVYERDEFHFAEGLEDELVHKPNLQLDDRGKPVRFYAVAKFVNGGHAFRVMSVAEVNKVRARSKARDEGPWVDFYEEMAQKTCLRQLANRGELPLTIEVAEAVASDEARELGFEPTEVIDLSVATRAPSAPSAGEPSDRQQTPSPPEPPVEGNLL